MFYWIYDIPMLAAVGMVAALFVAICWAAIILSRPIVEGSSRGRWANHIVMGTRGLGRILRTAIRFRGH